MNKLPTIGIIGGAGPEAGALLFRQMVRVCQEDFKCWHDRDFPLIHLLSYPFREMLVGEIDTEALIQELKGIYRKLDTDRIVIACNTLHSFLDDSFKAPQFFHLIEGTASELTSAPLLLCSSTSKRMKIHERVFPCIYPDNQQEVDDLIDLILAGHHEKAVRERLVNLIAASEANEVVLGCTELSLLHDDAPLNVKDKKIVDPSWVAAKKIIHQIFELRK